jgi:hypothetical protein
MAVTTPQPSPARVLFDVMYHHNDDFNSTVPARVAVHVPTSATTTFSTSLTTHKLSIICN